MPKRYAVPTNKNLILSLPSGNLQYTICLYEFAYSYISRKWNYTIFILALFDFFHMISNYCLMSFAFSLRNFIYYIFKVGLLSKNYLSFVYFRIICMLSLFLKDSFARCKNLRCIYFIVF